MLRKRTVLRISSICLGMLLSGASVAEKPAQSDAPTRQARDDAWWTGPVVAAGAGTLPQGRFLVEPYVYDAVSYGHFDGNGTSRSAPHNENFGSQTYLLYGLVDRITVGLIPRFGYSNLKHGKDSSKIGVGDLTLQGQYRLSSFTEGKRIPTVSVVLQETLPTGKYDRLGDNPADGQGGGAYVTTLAIYSQYYFWMPNGRILRTRFNVSRSVSERVSLDDESVYGTPSGFHGDAFPGGSLSWVAACEYSLTRNWVLAFDLLYQHDNATRVNGAITTSGTDVPLQYASGSSRRIGIVPAVEYNWSSRVGVIVGARWIGAARNADATLTPVAAINLIY